MFSSRFMPCPDCGESVDSTAAAVHRCDVQRLADYQMFGLTDDIARFESLLVSYLLTTAGRFEVWLAARQVRTDLR